MYFSYNVWNFGKKIFGLPTVANLNKVADDDDQTDDDHQYSKKIAHRKTHSLHKKGPRSALRLSSYKKTADQARGVYINR